MSGAGAGAGAGAASAPASLLQGLVGKVVVVVTLEGRNLVGTLRGYDSVGNIVLADAHERLFSHDKGMEQDPLGLYLVRGDAMGLMGELDAALDAAVDWDATRGAAPKAIVIVER